MKISVKKENIVISDYDELEVFKIAMKIELDGEKFYLSALERTTDERMKRTFKRLAEDENKHLSMFKSLYDGLLRGKGIEPSDAETDEDLFTYMETGIFNRDNTAKNVKDAVLTGEEVELRSILFYKEVEKNTFSESARKALSSIIAQEQMHLNILKSWEAAL